MPSAPATCPAADLVVRRLHALGARHVFGYPGGQLTPIYDALHRLGGIRHYLARHEQAAAFMADGFARATGQPGVVLAVCGPGVYNAATPLAAAHTDSVPVLLISGQVPRAGRGLRSGYYHENDQLSACAAFTKAQLRAESPGDVLPALDRAWLATTDGRPGPVVLEVPVDVLRAEVPAAELPPPPTPPAPLAPSAAEARALARLVSGWRRPLLLAGGGVISARAEALLVRLAERLGAPVFHSPNGKGAIPGRHPLCAGLPWHRATSDLSNMSGQFSPLLRDADGLLAVGCRFSQLTTGTWTMPLPPQLAHIDLDRAEVGRHYPPTLGIVADAREALTALIQALPAGDRTTWAAGPPRGEPWSLPGVDALTAFERALPDDAILSVDVTRLGYVLMKEWPAARSRTFLHPSGAVAMGYGLPAALGAKAAFPDRPVVAVVGDGGFQMCAMELATAVQERLPVVVLLVNDRCLTLIRATQERRYEGRFIATDLLGPDYACLAEAFGVGYWRPASAGQLTAHLREALRADRPAIIEVRPSDERPLS